MNTDIQQAIIQTLQSTSWLAFFIVFWRGAILSVNSCTIIRIPIVIGYVGGMDAFKYMPEQALVLRTPKGLTIVTGCAHPGIIKIIENVKQNISGTIYLVLGGFHLMDRHKKTISPIVDRFRQLRIERVAPTHCTGKDALKIFRRVYRDDFIDIKVGEAIEV